MKRYYSTLVALALFGICSGPSLAQNPAPVQTFYVPLPEPHMLTVLRELSTGLAANTNYYPANPMTRYIGISVIGKGTIIYYDQMENGYEADIANPTSIYDAVTNPSGTQIWGDGDPSNGAPPGIPSDLLEGGTTIILDGEMNTPGEPTAASPKFNGGDKIASSKAIAITTTVWAGKSKTLQSDAVEVYDTFSWGTNYRAPVGTNISIPGQSFEYVKAVIQAGPGGAAVEVRSTNNTLLASTNLTEGQSFFPTNNLSIGTRINADKPVQVDLITGDVAADSGEAYESRWYPLMPTNLWTSSYYTPVSTPSTSRGRGDSSDETGTATTVFLYNPGASTINVSYVTRGTSGASSDVSKFVTATNNFTANSRAWTNSPVGDVYAPLVSITATNNGFTNFGAPQGPWIGIIPRGPTNNLSNRVAAAQNGGATGIIIVNTNNATNNLTDDLGTLTIPVVGVYSNQNTTIRSTPLGDGWVSVTTTNAVVAKYVTTTNDFTSGVWNNSAPGNVYGPLVSITNTNTTVPTAPEGAWIGIIPKSPINNLSNRVVAARNAGAAAIVVVNTNNTTNNMTNNLGTLTIPVVGVASGQDTAIRSTPLGTGWVRVSGNQTTNTISVPAGGFNSQVVANGYGARFYSTNSQTFYAVSATDSTGTTNSFNRTWDWGFTLVPQTQLTAQALVGLGFGRDPTSGTRPNENGSPVWVSTVGNGNSNTTVYIDYDADPDTGRFIDPQGFRYDTTITLKELESVKVYNPSGNQSGMLLYSLDPNVRLVAA